MRPPWLSLFRSGELEKRAREARILQSPCRLCPRACGAARDRGERGLCGAGVKAKVFRCAPHFGEEPPLTGTAGSGTLFFSGCALRCAYCQNHRFSQGGEGREVDREELAALICGLKRARCHNLNLVTAAHFLPQVLDSLACAARRGFDLPLVYNTSGYESVEALRLLDGVVDVYLADMRYADPGAAARYSGARDYPEVNRAAAREMWRQVGRLELDEAGVARKGLIVRLLLLPGGVSGTRETSGFISRMLSPEASVSLMSQYTPCHRAAGDPVLGRRVSAEEARDAAGWLREAGLENGWVQECREGDERFLGAEMECNIPGRAP